MKTSFNQWFILGTFLMGQFLMAAPTTGIAPSNAPGGIRNPEPFVPTTVDKRKVPTDIYADYTEAKTLWATQQVAKYELQKFVEEQKKVIAMELKISEGIINTVGPALSEDGNVCTAYTVDRANLPAGNISDISTRMQAMARQLNSKNNSPIPDAFITATHYPALATPTSTVVQLLFTCLSPNSL